MESMVDLQTIGLLFLGNYCLSCKGQTGQKCVIQKNNNLGGEGSTGYAIRLQIETSWVLILLMPGLCPC